MKFLKSGFTKKLIIILISIIIFNSFLPMQSNASVLGSVADIAGGVLFKPVFSLITLALTSVDVTLGTFLNGFSIGVNFVGVIAELVMDSDDEALNNLDQALSKLFIGPDTIFSGEVSILNANIFSDTSTTSVLTGDDISGSSKLAKKLNELAQSASGANLMSNIKKGVSKIYNILRDICALIMLGGLIFTGIRILLSANIPNKKSQYLYYLQDWLIGMVLLVFSHVLMAGIFWISDTLTEALKNGLSGFGGLNFNIIRKALLSTKATTQIIMIIMLGYVIWLTVVFAIAYFKRLVWVVVLVVFAPVFSVMYAFGQQTKQIYSKWIREFCTTVLIQPFHMIIYSVLVAIPMNVTDASFGNSNLFNFLYALIAISMIRPAEKYMRDMFGMSGGIVNMASYDSGKQTLDAAKQTVDKTKEKVLQVGAVAAAAATGNYASAVKIATGSMQKDDKDKNSNGWEKEDVGALNADDGWDDAKGYLKFQAGVEGYDSVSAMREEQGDEHINDLLGIGGYSEKDLVGANNDALPEGTKTDDTPKNEIGEFGEKGDETSKGINASSVVINASNVELQGNATSGKTSNTEEGVNTEDGISKKEDLTKGESASSEDQEMADGDFDVNEGETKQKRKSPMKRLIGNATNVIKTAKGLQDGDESIFGVGQRMISKSKVASGTYNKIGEHMKPETKEKLHGLVEKGKQFEKLGGFGDLYKGLNGIRDTMFVGPAPQDWKPTAERIDQKQKQKGDQQIYNFKHNENNKAFIEKTYRAKAAEKYQDPDKQQDYLDKKMDELANAFAPLGIEDAAVAYQLQGETQKGYTPQQALINMKGSFIHERNFEEFNNRKSNVAQINSEYNLNATTVTEQIPEAKQMYDNGIQNVGEMMQIRYIKDQLNVTLDMAMKLNDALKNKGEAKYNGSDPEIKKKFDEINNFYKKEKGKK